MKYYINYEKNLTLIDENDYTPYLAERGYVEVTKEEFDTKNKELEQQYAQEHPKEFNGQLRQNIDDSNTIEQDV